MNTLWYIMNNQYQLPHHHLSFKKLIKSSKKKNRRFTPMNHPSLKGLWRWVKWISMRPLAYSMTLNNWCQILVGKFLHWRSHPSLKTWRRFKEQCETSKAISCLWFLIEKMWLSLMNCYMMHTWRIMRIIIRSQFKMNNFLKSCKTLVFPRCFIFS